MRQNKQDRLPAIRKKRGELLPRSERIRGSALANTVGAHQNGLRRTPAPRPALKRCGVRTKILIMRAMFWTRETKEFAAPRWVPRRDLAHRGCAARDAQAEAAYQLGQNR